ncbi:MAG: C69 family dipeptidase [Candidatus Hermodarchaeota archaeon]
MCDTLVALANASKDGSTIFGKNSDRPFDEAQLVTYSPRKRYESGDILKCTYIEIPQAKETHAVLLSQPWWMWGAEMGTNEYGVVIGNEAVNTLEAIRSIGLLGMDLLRLGLERGKTARDAMDTIIDLLETHGQGGGCAYNDPNWMYHNSFIIADPNEAYVLETADEWWIAEMVKSVRSISNSISIRGQGDIRRNGIIEHAIEKGYCKDDSEFDFAQTFSGSPISSVPSPYSRAGKATILLNNNIGEITPKLMMEFLREHQAGICMHGGFESTGSQVSHLSKEVKPIHWFTGTTLPCISIYKPYTFPIKGQKFYDSAPYESIDPDWFWVKHTARKPVSIKNELRNFEDSLISTIDYMLNQEERISEDKFVGEISRLNIEAWNKSYEMIIQ